VTEVTRSTSLRNFLAQGNGAEMLRLAACLVTEAAVEVCAPVHDALLIGAKASEIEETVAEARRLMMSASATVLGGVEVAVDAHVVRSPDRYVDPRGRAMWDRVTRLLNLGPQGAQHALSA
jgi:hypothetical protein